MHRSLIISTVELKKAEGEIRELKESLKTKTSELTRSKMLEGRLQIEVNKLHLDLDKCKANYTSNLTTIMKSFNELKGKAHCKRYDIVKAAMKQVFERDEKHFAQNYAEGEKFNSLDEDEVCEVIKSFILESFEAKQSYHWQMKKNLDRIIGLHQSKIDQEKSKDSALEKIDFLELDLKSQLRQARDKVIKYQSDYNQSLLREQTSLAYVTTLKQELEIAGTKDGEMRGVLSDLKDEMKELEKFLSSLRTKNEELEKQHEEQVAALQCQLTNQEQVAALQCQLTNQEQSAAATQLKNDELQKQSTEFHDQMEELKTELFEVEKLFQTVSEKNNELVKRETALIKEVEDSKQQLTNLKNAQDQNDPELKNKMLKLQSEMMEKDILIRTLQKNNDEVDAGNNVSL